MTDKVAHGRRPVSEVYQIEVGDVQWPLVSGQVQWKSVQCVRSRTASRARCVKALTKFRTKCDLFQRIFNRRQNQVKAAKYKVGLQVPIRLHRMHEMRRLFYTTDVPLCQSQSVCHAASLVFRVQKRLNGLRSCLGWRLLGAQGTLCYMRRPDPPTARGRRKGIRCSLCRITLASCLDYELHLPLLANIF